MMRCVQPETVAAYLVPRVRTVVARKAMSTYIKYLTIPRALVKFMSAPTKANKYFSKQGTHAASVHGCQLDNRRHHSFCNSATVHQVSLLLGLNATQHASEVF